MRCAGIFLYALLFTVPAAAQFTVTGTLAGGTAAEVVLLDEGGSVAASTRPGAGGRFEMSVENAGHYHLAIRSGGGFQILEKVLLTSGEPVARINAAAPRPFQLVERRQPDAPPLVHAGRLSQQIPKKARRLHDDAVRRRDKGEVEEAISKLTEAVALAPNFLEALNDLAVLYIRQQDYARAETALRQAVAIDSAAWQPRVNLGSVLLDQGWYREAGEELGRARTLAAGSPLPDFHLGRLYLLERRNTEAEEAFDRVLDIEPGFLYARLFRGYARMQAGRLEEARADVAAFLKVAPDNENARRRLVEIDRALRAQRGGQ